jgi:hypothetical protein
LKKVSNIYDVVTIDINGLVTKDVDRFLKKHDQVYGIDDTGLVVK